MRVRSREYDVAKTVYPWCGFPTVDLVIKVSFDLIMEIR